MIEVFRGDIEVDAIVNSVNTARLAAAAWTGPSTGPLDPTCWTSAAPSAAARPGGAGGAGLTDGRR